MIFEDEKVELEPRAVAYPPTGVRHQIFNLGNETLVAKTQ